MMMIDTQVNFYLYFHTQKNCQHYYFEIRVKKADTKVIGSSDEFLHEYPNR